MKTKKINKTKESNPNPSKEPKPGQQPKPGIEPKPETTDPEKIRRKREFKPSMEDKKKPSS